MDDLSWQATFERARSGDRAAFDSLCPSPLREQCRLAAVVALPKSLRGRVDADDVLQIAMEGAWRDLPKLRDTSRDGFQRWVRGVVAHRVQDEIRSSKRDRRDIAREIRIDDAPDSKLRATPLVDPLQKAATRELHDRIAEALDGLSESYRQVILLRVIEGRSTKEAAEFLDKSEDNVAVTLHRALIRLREQLTLHGVETTLFRPI